MTIKIMVSPGLADLDAQMRKSTFQALNKIKNLGTDGGNGLLVGDLGLACYMLYLVSDEALPADVLCVSPMVKERFYPSVDTLPVRPI